MPRYQMMQVDAFTTTPFSGNPCAVVFDADDMTETTMLRVAKEMNLSETAFVRKSGSADIGVRFFTPAEEIPLAGHPTIATVFALIDAGRLPIHGDAFKVTVELKDGPISVEVFYRPGTPTQIVMTQREPQFLSIF